MKLCTLVVAFVLSAPVAAAISAPPADESDAAAAIKTLLREHEESELGYVRAYEAFRPRFTSFAEAHRGTEPEVRAVLWLVQQAWWLRQEGTMEETAFPLAKYLLGKHPESPQLSLLVEYQYVFKRGQRREIFGKLLEVSPHRSVQGAAHFGLARLDRARTATGTPNPHLETLVEEYADEPWRLTTFGAIANAYLNPHSREDLAVGKPAPEIVGIDENKMSMRLSDYRGKVVLLDFWGHW